MKIKCLIHKHNWYYGNLIRNYDFGLTYKPITMIYPVRMCLRCYKKQKKHTISNNWINNEWDYNDLSNNDKRDIKLNKLGI